MQGSNSRGSTPSRDGPASDGASVSFAASELRDLGIDARSSSPAKRLRTSKSNDDTNSESSDRMDLDEQQEDIASPAGHYVSPIPNRFKPINGPQYQRTHAVDMLTDEKTSSNTHSRSDTASESNAVPASSPPTSTEHDCDEQSKDLPTLDKQVQTVIDIITNSLSEDGATGYIVSTPWLNRIRSRTTEGLHENYSKSLRDGDIGPIENSDILLKGGLPNLRDSNGAVFLPLNPGLRARDDYEILPPKAWELVVQWYGMVDSSLTIIRYQHNTSDNPNLPNYQYEIYPPLITIQKLATGNQTQGLESLADRDKLAVRLVTSRSEKLQEFLKRLKIAIGINMSTKVRVWKVVETLQASSSRAGILTPESSRANSPASQQSATMNLPKLIVPLSLLNAMDEGTQREVLDVKDETANSKYNGRSTVAIAGFPETQTLIIEEQIKEGAEEEYISDQARKANSVEGSKSDQLPVGDNDGAGSVRRSATPSGPRTRGRTNRRGRSKGNIGLQNLGNSCYMNSALQCIRAVEELTVYFLDSKFANDINSGNPLGYGGQIAKSYAGLVSSMYETSQSFSPRLFKQTLGRCQPTFSGYGQQDSQEFVSFLLDGLHEDLNRVQKKPYIENPDSDDNTVHDPEAIKQLGEVFRQNHRKRNDSIAVDLFSGFYKNTMICPVCEKVSVTFDPFSQVTLQLPVENTFQHIFHFSPLRGPPLIINVDIDKNSSFRAVKEYVTKRVPGRINPDHLVVAEEYQKKFYKVFENAEILSESGIIATDKLWLFELDATPTNWPPLEKTKSKFRSISLSSKLPSMHSQSADRMVIPIIHKIKNAGPKSGASFELAPSMIMITREEAKGFDSILRKVLQKISTMTTRPLFGTDVAIDGNQDDSNHDAEMMIERDVASKDPQVQARSVDSEDGLVDVSMPNDGHKSENEHERGPGLNPGHGTVDILDPAVFIEPELRQMFTMEIYTNSSNEPVPTSHHITTTTRLPSLDSRVPIPPLRRLSTSSSDSLEQKRWPTDSTESSEGEPATSNTLARAPETHFPESSDEDEHNTFRAGITQKFKATFKRKNEAAATHDDTLDYLIRIGEGLLIDWEEQSFDALFGGIDDTDFRGERTENKKVTIADPELDERKARRQARKKNGVTLDECFNETSKSEVLSEENAWYCSRCKELRRASKILEIWTVPDILVVHLKRFSSGSRLRDKIEVLVDFPVEGLDLSGKVGLTEDKSQIYDLFAVDNHIGGLGGGHYTAYAKNFYDNNWYSYNGKASSMSKSRRIMLTLSDSWVSKAKANDVITPEAYLLFYRRRSETALGPPYLQEIVKEHFEENLRPVSPSGEGRRTGDRFSLNGSSEGSLVAGAILQGDKSSQALGVAGGRALEPESPVKNAQNDESFPPAYSSQDFDEAISMGPHPDHPLPSYEQDNAFVPEFIGPMRVNLQDNRFAHSDWSFDALTPATGQHVKSASNMAIDLDDDQSTLGGAASDAPAAGSDDGDKMLEDFGDDMADDEALRGMSFQPGTPEECIDIREAESDGDIEPTDIILEGDKGA